ncbi:hypothetical protein T484DRAFT_1852925, partial [Baffinella frigidus]
MGERPSVATVFRFKQFPYLERGTKLVEREYWLRLDDVDKRLGNHDNIAILHVHYMDKWGDGHADVLREHEVISQMNIRHTVKDRDTPGKPVFKTPALSTPSLDEDKWVEKKGQEVWGPKTNPFPEGVWRWREDRALSPAMHQLLLEAETCTEKCRDEVEAVLSFVCEAAGMAPWKPPPEAAVGKRKMGHWSWADFCQRAEEEDVKATVVIDFPYADADGLDLKGDERLLERMYVFKDMGDGADKRVVVHVHTPLRWGARGKVTLQDRVDLVTSVNVRHAKREKQRFEQEQGNLKMPLVPVGETDWRGMWKEGDGSFESKCTWQWKEKKSMPTCEDERVAAKYYDQVRKIIKLGEKLGEGEPKMDHVETLSWVMGDDAKRTVEYEVVAVNAAHEAMVKPRALILSVEKYKDPKMNGRPVESQVNLLSSTLQGLGWQVTKKRDLNFTEAREAILIFATDVTASGGG